VAARSRARFDLRMLPADSSGPKWSKAVREARARDEED
jgi:hypothetical protein